MRCETYGVLLVMGVVFQDGSYSQYPHLHVNNKIDQPVDEVNVFSHKKAWSMDCQVSTSVFDSSMKNINAFFDF